MSVASWMIRNRNLRSSRSRRTRDSDPDYVKLDLAKDPEHNAVDILHGICTSSGVSEGKVLNYLNNYVKLITHLDSNFSRLGFNTEELFCCLRVACIHDSTHVRTAGLRAIRYSVKSVDHVAQLNNLQFPFLIARSLDLVSFNDIERVQALKLIRRILLVAPQYFEVSVGRSLISLANGSQEEKDRMLRACLAVLSELGVLNPELFISVGGVVAIIRNILECQTPRIAESLCGTLLHLLNHPYTRGMAAIDLQCLAAPYCDFHYRKKSSTGSERNEMAEERDLRFNCSRLALLSVLRSWPGILHFCNPTNPTCLKAMVDILYLEHLEVKNAVLDLLYELLNLPQPEWTDEFSVALNAVDPADAQDSWRLGDGFVAAEARSLLPHLARTTPNLAEIHLAVLLYTFIEVGLLTALAEVIVSGDTFICVRATVLLGELLHLSHQILPPDCCNITPPLPNLLMHATNKHQALAAVAALQDLHTMLKQRPASSSLFLDHILVSSNYFKSSTQSLSTMKTRSLTSRSKLYQFVSKDNEHLLRDSAVLQNKDGYTWDWDIIRTILKDNVEGAQKLDDSNHKAFIKRLVHYFKPSSNRFSHMDLSSLKQTQKYTLVGCDLISYLLNVGEPDGIKLLMELFEDISVQIDAITSSKSAHDCLFSPQHMSNTCCQKYFLLIGHLTHSPIGLDVLTKTGIFEQLLKLSTSTNHDCYVKLIISSLDYSADAFPRKILAKTLICNLKVSRLYATQFLLVLLRAKVYYFDQWGIELLVNQLFDQSKAVSLTALNILHEACEEKIYLEKLVSLKPDLINLGDNGLLLLIRFLSTPNGYAFLQHSNFIANEIHRWITNFNYRYVRIIEEDLHDSLTLHQRNEDGHYNRRISSVQTVFRRDIFTPPHLYGQLVQHTKGFNTLLELANLTEMFICIEQAICNTELEILELKASLWACGHVATSAQGVELLSAHNVIASTINIAKTCPVYALRGTAIYVLGIMSTTYKGATELFKLGWVCTRHDRHERWPVIEGENWDLDSQPLQSGSDKPTESESDRVSETSILHFWNEDSSKAGGDFYLPEPDGSVTDEEFFPNIEHAQQKSSTLPHQANLTIPKHQRSLSESKTIDVISTKQTDQVLKTITNRLSQSSVANNRSGEILMHRHRDCSESSTSGVSSCDSMVAKFVISERIPTLSPIPSSSSLSTLKPLSFQVQNRKSDYHRRISVQSNAFSDIATVSPTESARLSHQDLLGITTLRSLRHHRKPCYFDTSGDEISAIVSGGSDKVKLGSSLGSRSLKVRSLDRQHTQLSFTDIEGSTFPNPILTGISSSSLTSMTKRTSLLRNSEKNGGQCYMGICMPRNLMDIFPNDRVNYKGMFKAVNYVRKPGATRSTANVSSSNTEQITISTIHDTTTCLNCCRSIHTEQLLLLDVFASCERRATEQPSTSQKPITTSDSNDPQMKLDILKHVERLSNPVWYKQSRQALLQTKQKHPQLFHDICLYSEACKIISSVSMRLMARRFLQEIFQDINFDVLCVEPGKIISDKKQKINSKESKPVTVSAERVKNTNEVSAKTEPMSTSDDFVRVRYFNSDSAQRSAELSGLVQSRETVNRVVVASSSNNTITKGFIVDTSTSETHKVIIEKPISISNSEASASNRDLPPPDLQQVPLKNFGPIRSPPLASVKEETLSSVENLLDIERTTTTEHKLSEETKKLDLYFSPEDVKCSKLVSPRGQKTLVDSLSLSCSKNKFPITTRYQIHLPTITRSYSFSKAAPLIAVNVSSLPKVSDKSNDVIDDVKQQQQPNNAILSANTHIKETNSISTTHCVPKQKANQSPE